MVEAIPQRLHFVWIGKSLPLFAQLAMESALSACAGARLTLWVTDPLDAESCKALPRDARFELSRLDAAALFEGADASLPIALLERLFATLTQPAARANLARLLLLSRHGGVYLDTDTITVRDLAPLYPLGAFCGLEHVIWPLEKRYGISPYRVIGGPLRGVLRDLCARVPRGERLFHVLGGAYPLAANNAVLGFTAHHPFLRHMLLHVSRLAPEELTRRYRLGTHLLQESLASVGKELSVHALSPAHFYPLGPVMSHQYFRRRKHLDADLAHIVTEETYLVHWYASVSELLAYDAERMRRERDLTVFARLCERVLGARALGAS
jgi:hypothetical protein